MEIGLAKSVDNNGKYDTGQTFVHRLYDYRGYILFDFPFDNKNKIGNFKNQVYYKCLIDNRDVQHIVSLISKFKFAFELIFY